MYLVGIQFPYSSDAEKKFLSEKMDLLVNTRVIEVRNGEVELKEKNKTTTSILPFGICVWCTGIMAPPLIDCIFNGNN